MPDLTALIDGNRKAQRAFYESYKIPMFKLCRMYVKDKHTAEDLLQEGFIKIFKALDTFDVDKGNLVGWMRKIMTNTCLMHLRKQKRQFEVVELKTVISDLTASFDETKLSSLSLNDIYEILHELPDGYRSVFILYFIEGLSHVEIADVLHITESTSKSQLFKSKKKMKELMISRFPDKFRKYQKSAQEL